MTHLNLTPEQFTKVAAKIGREVEEWLRDNTVEPHYSVERLAELLMVTESTVESYITKGARSLGQEGIYPVRRLSFKTMRIPASSVNRFLHNCTVAAPVTESVEAGT